MNPGSGTVQATPQEQALTQLAQASFDQYRKNYLPMQDHLSDVVSSMGKSDSWQRQEAEGKGNEDAASEFAQAAKARTASELDRGINVGSSRFKMGVAGMATAEAESKGVGIEEGNQAIDKAYLGGLTAIARAGQGIAGAATNSASLSAQVASREAISNAQEANSERADKLAGIGFLVGSAGQTALGGNPGGGATSNPFTDLGNGYGMQFQQNMAQSGGINLGAGGVENLPGA